MWTVRVRRREGDSSSDLEVHAIDNDDDAHQAAVEDGLLAVFRQTLGEVAHRAQHNGVLEMAPGDEEGGCNQGGGRRNGRGARRARASDPSS